VLAFGLFLPGIELFESLVLDPVGNERQVRHPDLGLSLFPVAGA
jgi:hypothetical protein